MKGIILAGGTGSRLFPLTKVTNKHLLPVGKYPMILYLIAKIKEIGINDIMIISGKEDIGSIAKLLGSGYEYGIKITYKAQDQPGGIAQALGLCEDFVNKEKCLVILGDNIFNTNLDIYIEDFLKQDKGAKVLLYEVKNPKRYGIAEIKENKVVGIEEKPENPKSNYCVTGIYMYDNRVFNIIHNLKPSARKELEITDINNWYINVDSLSYDILNGWWSDAGTFDSLYNVNLLTKGIDLEYILARDYKK